MGHVRPATERPQSRPPQQLLEGTEREVANVSGRARTGVELDVVRRATEDELCAAAERHQVGCGDRQPTVRLEHAGDLVDQPLSVEDVLDDFGRHDRGEGLGSERKTGFDLRTHRPETSGGGRAERRVRDVHADQLVLVHHGGDELAVVAAQVEQPSARAPRQQLPQPRRARDVKP